MISLYIIKHVAGRNANKSCCDLVWDGHPRIHLDLDPAIQIAAAAAAAGSASQPGALS